MGHSGRIWHSRSVYQSHHPTRDIVVNNSQRVISNRSKILWNTPLRRTYTSSTNPDSGLTNHLQINNIAILQWVLIHTIVRLLTSCSFLTIIFISLVTDELMYLGKDELPVQMGKISFVRGCLSSRRLSLQDSPYICLLLIISICQHVTVWIWAWFSVCE